MLGLTPVAEMMPTILSSSQLLPRPIQRVYMRPRPRQQSGPRRHHTPAAASASSLLHYATVNVASLSAVYSRRWMRRRYEVWFLRFRLADGCGLPAGQAGAWWFRDLRMNPGRNGCPGNPAGQPVQVWATWFPRNGTPQSFIQGFAQDGLSLSAPGAKPFHFEIGPNRIDDDSCRGRLEVEGHRVEWNLRCRSTFAASVTEVGWIGFSRTPNSDGVFYGEISLDGRQWSGDPLGFGLQGHNCGFRHRHLWNWAHCVFQTDA